MNKLTEKLTNLELKDEIEKRIKSGEWRIETGHEDTWDGSSSFRYISNFSFPADKNERRFLEVSSLLEEQDEVDKNREKEEIKKDNSRIEDWEKMEKLVSFDIEKGDGWGGKKLIVECKQCGKMNKHVYFNWLKWKDTQDIRTSTVLSVIEYEWEVHLAQGHENESRVWTEERQKFPKYDEWLKSRNEGLWKARQMNK